jgi:hypothetical protein
VEKVNRLNYLALNNVHSETTHGGLFVFVGHIQSGLPHSFNHHVERNFVGAISIERKPGCSHGGAGCNRVAFNAGKLDEAPDRITGQS